MARRSSTSQRTPETMLAMVKGGVVDFIGAARPSIADPFLPQKIRDDRQDDIRECIGCNICYASDLRGVPIRCTQNPTMGEEWRRGWHPESVSPARRPARALIVGSGPAGLEAAHILGKRGVEVVLAEAEEELGGRVRRESRLPGFSEWMRVADYRINQLAKLGGVTVYRASRMTAGDVVDTGIAHVFVATGSRWRMDGRGRLRRTPVPSFADERVIGVDAILDGARPEGPIVVADDDNFYMASAIAEALAGAGREVAYVASDLLVASWAVHTYDQARIDAALDRLGITIVLNHRVTELMDGAAVLTCMFTGRTREIACRTLVPVTSREPEASLWHALRAQHGARFETLIRIGDCAAPGLIAHAVHDGHRAAREFDMEAGDGVARRDRVVLMSAPQTVAIDGIDIAYRHEQAESRRTGILWLSGFRSDMAGTKSRPAALAARRDGLPALRLFRSRTISGNFAEQTLAAGRQSVTCSSTMTTRAAGPGRLQHGRMAHAAGGAGRGRLRVAGLVLIAPAPDLTEALMWAMLYRHGAVRRCWQPVRRQSHPPMASPHADAPADRGRDAATSCSPTGSPIRCPVASCRATSRSGRAVAACARDSGSRSAGDDLRCHPDQGRRPPPVAAQDLAHYRRRRSTISVSIIE